MCLKVRVWVVWILWDYQGGGRQGWAEGKVIGGSEVEWEGGEEEGTMEDVGHSQVRGVHFWMGKGWGERTSGGWEKGGRWGVGSMWNGDQVSEDETDIYLGQNESWLDIFISRVLFSISSFLCIILCLFDVFYFLHPYQTPQRSIKARYGVVWCGLLVFVRLCVFPRVLDGWVGGWMGGYVGRSDRRHLGQGRPLQVCSVQQVVTPVNFPLPLRPTGKAGRQTGRQTRIGREG